MWALKANASPYKRSRGRVDTQRREGSVTPEAEIGVMWPPAKERQQPPGAKRDKDWIPSRASAGSAYTLM